MSFTIRAPLDSTTWRPTGRDEFCLVHVTCAGGLLSTVHLKMAVWLSLTVVSTGACSREGADVDLPGSPFTPFLPGGPTGPAGPGSPSSPRSPFTPVAPGGPIGPCFPGGPSGPGLPRVPGLPRRPRLPRQSVSSLAQTRFCSSRSSFSISSFTSTAVWTDFCWELVGDERFCLEMFSWSPWKHN